MTTTADPPAARRSRRWVDRWWVYTARPMSLRVAWRLSGAVDTTRVPGCSPAAAAVWWWANRTERLLLFAVVILAPTVLTGPLLWCAARPSRRLGLYVVLAGLAGLFTAAGS